MVDDFLILLAHNRHASKVKSSLTKVVQSKDFLTHQYPPKESDYGCKMQVPNFRLVIRFLIDVVVISNTCLTEKVPVWVGDHKILLFWLKRGILI